MRAKKGSAFERTIAKQFSLWWTNGKRDDVFWRVMGSGGRATNRAQKGLSTYASYGDIAAVDPIGLPLLKLFTIELKRGAYGIPGDLLDFKNDNQCHPWVKCLKQTIRSAMMAKSQGWMLICKRDNREPMVYMDLETARELNSYSAFLGRPFVARYDIVCQGCRIRFVALRLRSFLARIKPKEIKAALP